MDLRTAVVVVLSVALIGPGGQALAEGGYVGGGIQSASFGDDLNAFNTGVGPYFSGGYGFTEILAVDLLWGASLHDESLAGVDLAHGDLLVGLKLTFPRGSIQPYVVAGLASHAIAFEDTFGDIVGTGTHWGIGVDIFFERQQAINLSFRRSNWEGEDDFTDYDVTTDITAIAYNFYFSK